MESAQTACKTPAPRCLPAAGAALEAHLLRRGDARRPVIERFIADAYARTYGARVTHYADEIVGLRRGSNAWIGAVGYTMAERGPLFVEQYLDRPIESEIAAKAGIAIRREAIAEVSNLAAPRSGAARHVIVHMTRLLHELGRTWVVFTSTRELLNSFDRLGIKTIVLARAEPCRLPDGGASWGSYYTTEPCVVTANLTLGFAHLHGRTRAFAR